MFKQTWKTEALVDVVNLALGAFLFLSPWIFGFTSGIAIHTSWVAGTAICIVAALSIGDLFGTVSLSGFFEEEEWINLSIGLWLVACPWIIGMSGDTAATQVHVLVGLVVAAIAGVELWLVHHTPPQKPWDAV